MPKLTQEQREAGLDEVEAVLMAGKWSRRAQYQIAKRHGVTRRTIQSWRARVEKQWSDAIKTAAIEDERAGWLARVRMGQNVAIQKGDVRAYCNLLSVEARVLGIESPTRLQLSGSIDLTARPERQLTDEELDAEIARMERERAGKVIELREVGDGRHEPAG